MADINLQVGPLDKGTVFVLRDSVTNNPISGVVYANLTFNNSNPGVATFAPNPTLPNPQGGVKAHPVSVGSGTVDISVQVTYMDAGDGQSHTETKTLTKTFDVIGAPNGASIELNF